MGAHRKRHARQTGERPTGSRIGQRLLCVIEWCGQDALLRPSGEVPSGNSRRERVRGLLRVLPDYPRRCAPPTGERIRCSPYISSESCTTSRISGPPDSNSSSSSTQAAMTWIGMEAHASSVQRR